MDQVDEVKSKTDIVAVIGEHVKLTKAGRHFKGLCPFHGEKTPSFMVSPEMQIYKCFGCGKGGDVYSFLQDYEGMEFYEALSFLADRAGVKLTPRKGGANTTSIKSDILEANALAARFYSFLLAKHKLGEPGREYVFKKRGLEEKTVSAFGLGFAPSSPSILFDTLTKKKNIKPEIMEAAGLVYQTSRGPMDRFRGRVVFPIANHRGEVVALAGRILPEHDDGKSGKYINSPETPVYHKSSSLYGLDITKKAIRDSKTAVVVEGELDLLSAWQSGIKNIVAIKGTAMTTEHVRILARFAEKLVLALDADFAGDTAAIRGLSYAQNEGLALRVASMGKYKDPDEYARADPDGLRQAIAKAIDAWEFVVNVAVKRHDVSVGDGKSRASRELMPIISSIEDRIVRSHYLQKVANKLDVPFEAVAAEAERYAKKEVQQAPITSVAAKERTRREILEERLLALTIGFSPQSLDTQEFGSLIKNPLFKKLVQHMDIFIKDQSKFDLTNFSASLPEELSGVLAQIVMKPEFAEDQSGAEKEIEMTKKQIVMYELKNELNDIAKAMSREEEKGNKKTLKQLQKDFQKISSQLAKLQDEA